MSLSLRGCLLTDELALIPGVAVYGGEGEFFHDGLLHNNEEAPSLRVGAMDGVRPKGDGQAFGKRTFNDSLHPPPARAARREPIGTAVWRSGGRQG
jgi:hypothetical protein